MPESAGELPSVLWMPSDRAWMDPPLVGRQLYTQPSIVTLGSTDAEPLARPNPMRWAIYFSVGSGVGGSPVVAPWSDIQGAGGWTVDPGVPVRFTLTLDASAVMAGWYGRGMAGTPIRVFEIIRQT